MILTNSLNIEKIIVMLKKNLILFKNKGRYKISWGFKTKNFNFSL